MGLSSNIIWHQTNTEGGKAILESKKLLCSYSLETIKWNTAVLTNAFPMISFCDLPIADMSEYLTHNKTGLLSGKYGEVTIGFKKEFREKNKICPVWYLPNNSNFIKCLMKLRNDFVHMKNEGGDVLWNSLASIKNIEGSLIKYDFSSYRFYDEKEIRFIPTLETLKALKIRPFLKEKEYDEYKELIKNKFGIKAAIIPEIFIEFNYSDIDFILIYDDKEIKSIQKIINKESNQIKILTYSQVAEDIIGLNHTIKSQNS